MGNAGTRFVGRAAAMAELRGALDAACTGRAAIALVSGEAGIGKTAVLTELAEQAHATGALVAWGTCWADDRAPAFWPWTQAARDVLTATGDDPAPEGATARALDRLLGRVPPGDDPGDDDAQARFRLLDGIVQWLEAVARRRPVMVVLDDLQWADTSSFALFELLSRKPRGRLLLAGSYRHDELTEAASKRGSPRWRSAAVTCT